MSKRYDSPEAFRQALQTRLRTIAAERDLSVQDVQTKFLIERLLARLFHLDDPPWFLKGGFAMELRYRPHARTTKDVDLTIRTNDERGLAARLDAIREQLQTAAELDLGDHLEFRIASAKKQLPGARWWCNSQQNSAAIGHHDNPILQRDGPTWWGAPNGPRPLRGRPKLHLLGF